MAYFESFQDDDDKKNEQQTQTGEMVLTPQSSQAGGAAGSAAQTSTEQSAGGRRANLQDFTQANQPRSEQFTQDFTQGITTQGRQTKEAADQFVDAAQKGIQPGGPKINQKEIDRVKAGDASGVNADTWTDAFNAVYGGPDSASSVEGWDDVNRQNQDFGQTFDMSQTFEGRGQILRDQTPQDVDYSQGANWLDSFLLSSAPNADQSFGRVQEEFGDFQDAWRGQQESVNRLIADAQTTTAEQRQAIQEAILQGRGALMSEAEARRAQEQQYLDQILGPFQGINPESQLNAQFALFRDATDEDIYLNQFQDMLNRGIDPMEFVSIPELRIDQFVDQDRAGDWNQLLGAIGLEGVKTADPFRQTDVIDRGAWNQAFEGWRQERIAEQEAERQEAAARRARQALSSRS